MSESRSLRCYAQVAHFSPQRARVPIMRLGSTGWTRDIENRVYHALYSLFLIKDSTDIDQIHLYIISVTSRSNI